MALSERHQRFVDEMLIDDNAAGAYVRVGFSPKSADAGAARLMARADIQAALAEARADRSVRTKIDADAVLRHWNEVANADANDLIEYRRGACRYCHGKDHFYQWRDHVEFAEALAKGRKPTPTDEGGYGYRHIDPADPDCPRCCGEGTGYEFVHPSRSIPARSRALYAGVERTKDGLKVKMQDPEAAWDKIAKHLGLSTERADLSVKHSFENMSDEELAAEIAAYEKGSDKV